MDFILHVEEYIMLEEHDMNWKNKKFTNKIVLQLVGGGAQSLQ